MKFSTILLTACCCVISNVTYGADSQRAWPIITFTCDKENNQLKIRNEIKWGDEGKNFPFDAEKGTYNPWHLVKLEKTAAGVQVTEARRLDLSCRLFGGEYHVEIHPRIFNHNFDGLCGNRLSVRVSIYSGEDVLLEDRELEKFCTGNSSIVRGIKVNGINRKLKVYEVPRSRF